MKKTMFITSVIMVVVMAIALTTSSLAWFTAAGNSSVRTAEVSITAQSNASSGLVISNSAAAGFGSANAALTDTGNLWPVLPLGGATVTNTDTSAAHTANQAALTAALGAVSFIGNKVKTEDNVLKFSGTAYQDSAATSVSHVFNHDLYVASTGSTEVHVSPTITFGSSNHGATLYVAVLTKDGNNAWELLKLANSGSGSTVDIGKEASNFDTDATVSTCFATETYEGIGTTSTTLAAKDANAAYGTPKLFKIVAWYAQDLYNDNSGAYDATNNSTGTNTTFYVTFEIPQAERIA